MGADDDLRDAVERLARLGRTPDVDIRPVLLRVLVDLFVRRSHHAPADLAQFKDMIGRLLDDADAEVRQAVAEKLAGHPMAPRALLDRLLGEGGDIAVPVLARALLEAPALADAAEWGTAAMAMAVAGRPDLSAAVVDQLAGRPEPEVLRTLAENGAAPLAGGAFRYLVRRARGDEALSRALLRRGAPPADCAPLFLLADSAQRSEIMLAMRREDLTPDGHRRRPSPDEAAALARVERSVMAQGRQGFDAALAAALDLRVEDAHALIDDARGEPLALALAAVGASPEFAARVFILGGPAIGHSVMAVRSLTALVETMPRRTAARLVRAMTQAGARVLPRRPEPESAPRVRAGDGRARAQERGPGAGAAPPRRQEA